jgi:CBS domain-containing protein
MDRWSVAIFGAACEYVVTIRYGRRFAMKVKDIMTRNPAYCEPRTSLLQVAKTMCHHNCGEIPVVENSDNLKPVGVITDRDIVCRSLAQGKNPLDLRASDCMSKPVTTVTPDMSVEECCQILREHKIRRAPVVDERGRCCGMVSQADIAIKARAAAMTQEFLAAVSTE